MTWLAVAGGYEVTLREDKVICRNAAGKVLRSVPAAVRDDDVVLGLKQLAEWLARHGTACKADIERWMIRSLPVPATLLAEVWPDEAWRIALTDLVVAALDGDGDWDPAEVGFLRDVTPDGLGVVNLDGETLRLAADRVAVPHPVLLPDLDDLREFAADLGVNQSVDQLFRQTWTKPSTVDPGATGVDEFSGGKYEQLRHLMARAASQGYQVRGGYAVCRIVERGRVVEARSWLGADDPSYETETGDLVFTGSTGTSMKLGEVGPVAWSEGMRMAATLYAGRVIEKEGEDA